MSKKTYQAEPSTLEIISCLSADKLSDDIIPFSKAPKIILKNSAQKSGVVCFYHVFESQTFSRLRPRACVLAPESSRLRPRVPSSLRPPRTRQQYSSYSSTYKYIFLIFISEVCSHRVNLLNFLF